MYNLLLKLMIFAALIQLGVTASDIKNCRSAQCTKHFEKRSRDILKIDWKPMSVWSEEAKRFK